MCGEGGRRVDSQGAASWRTVRTSSPAGSECPGNSGIRHIVCDRRLDVDGWATGSLRAEFRANADGDGWGNLKIEDKQLRFISLRTHGDSSRRVGRWRRWRRINRGKRGRVGSHCQCPTARSAIRVCYRQNPGYPVTLQVAADCRTQRDRRSACLDGSKASCNIHNDPRPLGGSRRIITGPAPGNCKQAT